LTWTTQGLLIPMQAKNWTDAESPDGVYFSESQRLYKLSLSDDLWKRAQENMDLENTTKSDLITFLKMDNKSELMEVEN